MLWKVEGRIERVGWTKISYAHIYKQATFVYKFLGADY